MVYLVKNNQFDKNYKEIKLYLINNENINKEKCQDYSIELLKNDILILINNFKKVISFSLSFSLLVCISLSFLS
jgi:hypothetical protein